MHVLWSEGALSPALRHQNPADVAKGGANLHCTRVHPSEMSYLMRKWCCDSLQAGSMQARLGCCDTWAAVGRVQEREGLRRDAFRDFRADAHLTDQALVDQKVRRAIVT